MTGRRQIHARSVVVIALAYGAGALAYPYLPGLFLEQHRLPRLLIAVALPTTALVIYWLFRSLWRNDRVRTGNGAFEATYQAIVFRALLFVVALHAIVMLLLTDAMDTMGIRSWGGRTVVVLLGLTIAAIGNLLPRTRPNVAFGVRTPRTLTNVQLWQQVHRVGGYTTVALGLAILIAGLVISNNGAGAFVLLAAGIAAAVVYVSYRRLANA